MIIGIGHKKQRGKDTVGAMIQHVMAKGDTGVYRTMENFIEGSTLVKHAVSGWQVKRFGDKLKEVLCILTGCKMEDFDDEKFKNSELPREWTRQQFYRGDKKIPIIKLSSTGIFGSRIEIPTYRHAMQEIGTDLFRHQFHPDTWVNAMMSEYREKVDFNRSLPPDKNWIITDVRFPNEVDAIKSKKGILLRVDRDVDYAMYLEAVNQGKVNYSELNSNQEPLSIEHFRRENLPASFKAKWWNKPDTHESETILDDYDEWDYIIENNGTKERLYEKVIEFCVKFKLIDE